MSLGPDRLRTLLRLVESTREREIDCSEFLRLVPAWLDEAAERGELRELSADVAHHLRICPECLEEFEALLSAMTSGEAT